MNTGGPTSIPPKRSLDGAPRVLWISGEPRRKLTRFACRVEDRRKDEPESEAAEKRRMDDEDLEDHPRRPRRFHSVVLSGTTQVVPFPNRAQCEYFAAC